MPSVEITISKDGAVTVEAFGFVGNSCQEATEFLDKLFQKQSTKHKSSYYQISTQLVDPLPSGFCG